MDSNFSFFFVSFEDWLVVFKLGGVVEYSNEKYRERRWSYDFLRVFSSMRQQEVFFSGNRRWFHVNYSVLRMASQPGSFRFHWTGRSLPAMPCHAHARVRLFRAAAAKLSSATRMM
jgi:hypothetical protein